MATRETQKGTQGKPVAQQPRANKQKEVTAQTFVRLSKGLKKRADGYTAELATALREVSEALKEEADLLRGMR